MKIEIILIYIILFCICIYIINFICYKLSFINLKHKEAINYIVKYLPVKFINSLGLSIPIE